MFLGGISMVSGTGLKSENLFSDFARDYDRMINWEVRLKREAPFYQKIFAEAKALRVLDSACGTGRHAIMFDSWGLSVEASDVSEEMIVRARKNAELAGSRAQFKVANLMELDKVFTCSFDVITCMGNSLPHLKTTEELNQAFSSVSHSLRPSGLFVTQLRNYERVYEKEEKFMPLNSKTEGSKEYLYLRMSELGEQLVTFNIIVFEKDENGQWSYRVESEELRPWSLEKIEPELRDAGFCITGIYGSLNFEEFQPLESTDLVIIAKKTA